MTLVWAEPQGLQSILPAGELAMEWLCIMLGFSGRRMASFAETTPPSARIATRVQFLMLALQELILLIMPGNDIVVENQRISNFSLCFRSGTDCLPRVMTVLGLQSDQAVALSCDCRLWPARFTELELSGCSVRSCTARDFDSPPALPKPMGGSKKVELPQCALSL